MKYLLLPLTLLATSVYAELPEQCIQKPDRLSPCQHQIYKAARLTDPTTGEQNKKVVCVCISDFEQLRQSPATESEKIQQKMELKMLSQQLQLPEQELLDLIRY